MDMGVKIVAAVPEVIGVMLMISVTLIRVRRSGTAST